MIITFLLSYLVQFTVSQAVKTLERLLVSYLDPTQWIQGKAIKLLNVTCYKIKISCFKAPGFPKIDHSGSSASHRVWTHNPRTVVLTSSVYSLFPSQLCLKDWDFKDFYIIMLYRFELNPRSPKAQKMLS